MKFIDYPYEVFSFHQPLGRKKHFLELSTFMELQCRQRGLATDKNDDKCKTKFSTYKKKVQREISKKKKRPDYDFIDYILE
jgi:hypothetical protein